MITLKTAVLGAVLAAGAALPLFAAPRCSNGQVSKLSGDLFAPVECSTAALTAPILPGLSVVRAGKDVKADLRDLDGRWEGTLINGIGRYALLLTVKTGWSGKTELSLDSKELQFRDRLSDRLVLVPAKGRGAYEALLTASLAPEASLKGDCFLGAATAPASSTSTAKPPPPDRQADITFANGAIHRVYFALGGKNEMRVRAFSGIPGAALQKFEIVLTRTTREAL